MAPAAIRGKGWWAFLQRLPLPCQVPGRSTLHRQAMHNFHSCNPHTKLSLPGNTDNFQTRRPRLPKQYPCRVGLADTDTRLLRSQQRQ
jgi:hypothetical protein